MDVAYHPKLAATDMKVLDRFHRVSLREKALMAVNASKYTHTFHDAITQSSSSVFNTHSQCNVYFKRSRCQ